MSDSATDLARLGGRGPSSPTQASQILAVVLIAFSLRGALVAVSPVLDQIRRDTGLSSSLAGLLTTLPVLCFAAFSPAAPRLARRWQIERVLAAAMALLVGGIALRLFPSTVLLFSGTLALGAAIAAANVLLPALLKRDFPARLGLLTGVYVTVMSAGATLAGGMTVVLEHATGLTWRPTLGLWALPALAAFAACVLGFRGRQHGPASAMPPRPGRTLYRDALAWQVTLFMGLQSLIYYSTVAWLPTLFIAQGMSETRAGLLFGATNLVGLPASLAAPVLAGRRPTQTRLIVITSVLTAAGLLGIVVAPTSVPIVWMVLLGLGQGATIGLALTMIGLRAPDSEHASDLSGMAQSVGYLIAAIGPVALGLIHQATGSWTAAFVLTLVAVVPQFAFGLGAARDRHIGRLPT